MTNRTLIPALTLLMGGCVAEELDTSADQAWRASTCSGDALCSDGDSSDGPGDSGREPDAMRWRDRLGMYYWTALGPDPRFDPEADPAVRDRLNWAAKLTTNLGGK